MRLPYLTDSIEQASTCVRHYEVHIHLLEGVS